LDGGEPVELVKDLTLLGRKEDCDLRLDHKSVSKLHCVILKTEGLLLVRDLGSTNSTRVNGQRIRRAALLPSDQLTIANFKFKVQFGDAPAPGGIDSEHTQQLDVKEVVELLHRMNGPTHGERAVQPIQPNYLPDVYPEDPPKKR
jgi:pSer/pThr/pTyr-binding forkhead associated (FHA) protein